MEQGGSLWAIVWNIIVIFNVNKQQLNVDYHITTCEQQLCCESRITVDVNSYSASHDN